MAFGGLYYRRGVEIDLLRKFADSMRITANEAGVKIVTGDTKVVERGSADKVFITTSGVGVIPPKPPFIRRSVQAGDVAIVNGYLGDHGATIAPSRGDLALNATIPSDCQPFKSYDGAIFRSRQMCVARAMQPAVALPPV